MTRRPSSSRPRTRTREPGPANIDHYYSRRIPKSTVSSAPLHGWPEARTASLARLTSPCERILRLTRKEGTNLTQKDFIEPQRDLADCQYYGLSTRTLAMIGARAEKSCHKNRHFFREISPLWNVPSKLLGYGRMVPVIGREDRLIVRTWVKLLGKYVYRYRYYGFFVITGEDKNVLFGLFVCHAVYGTERERR